MIGIDGSGRDGMEEERSFPLTYSPSFVFFYSSPFFIFPIPFSSTFFLSFLEMKISYINASRIEKDLHGMRI